MNAPLTTQPKFVTLPTFQVIEQGPSASAMLNRFQQWLRDGGYAETNVTTCVTKARWLLSLLLDPGMLSASPDAVIPELKFAMEQHSQSVLKIKFVQLTGATSAEYWRHKPSPRWN